MRGKRWVGKGTRWVGEKVTLAGEWVSSKGTGDGFIPRCTRMVGGGVSLVGKGVSEVGSFLIGDEPTPPPATNTTQNLHQTMQQHARDVIDKKISLSEWSEHRDTYLQCEEEKYVLPVPSSFRRETCMRYSLFL